jgi:tRNA 2-thiouridine synthesizing protein A
VVGLLGRLTGRPDVDDAVYDLRGLKCPLPVLKARRRLNAMAHGERLWIETTDPLAAIDIPNLCREDGHELIESVAAEGFRRFLVKRGPGVN